MEYYDDRPQTIIIYDSSDFRASLVLKPDGEPFMLTKANKIGFDLTHKDKKIAREATG